jgi:hypothetical protein
MPIHTLLIVEKTISDKINLSLTSFVLFLPVFIWIKKETIQGQHTYTPKCIYINVKKKIVVFFRFVLKLLKK